MLYRYLPHCSSPNSRNYVARKGSILAILPLLALWQLTLPSQSYADGCPICAQAAAVSEAMEQAARNVTGLSMRATLASDQLADFEQAGDWEAASNVASRLEEITNDMCRLAGVITNLGEAMSAVEHECGDPIPEGMIEYDPFQETSPDYDLDPSSPPPIIIEPVLDEGPISQGEYNY
jgi:hypothetical protein